MISAGGNRDFEFIYEANGNPRNEGADKLGGIPADSPLDVLRADRLRRHEPDRVLLLRRHDVPARRPARAAVDVHQPEDRPGGAVRPGARPCRWRASTGSGSTRTARGGGGSRRRRRQLRRARRSARRGSASAATRARSSAAARYQIPAQPGDIYQTRNDAKNLTSCATRRRVAWAAIAKLNFEGTAQYHQAGIMVYGDDDNFTKFGRIAHTRGRRREVRVHLREQRRRRATRRPTRPRTSRRTSRTTSGCG